MIIGWSKGIAARVNFPNISAFLRSIEGPVSGAAGLAHRGGRGTHGALPARVGLLSHPSHVLAHNPFEQTRLDRGEKCDRAAGRGFPELSEAVRIQNVGRLPDLLHPGMEFLGRGGDGLEMHVRVAAAAELLIMPGIHSGFVGHEIQAGLHARHGVHLAAQLGNEKGGHHRVRGKLETQWHVGRKNELVDDGDIRFGIDEQPLPVQGHHFNGEWFTFRGDRFVGVQAKGAGPGEISEDDDDGDGNQPDERFDLGGIGPFRGVGGLGVGGAVLPGKPKRHDENGNNHDQHEQDGRHDEKALGITDGPFRIQQHQLIAAGKHHREPKQPH
ncbi:hypothetical protein DESC_930050 [Desulfosarcina cetonica]|nr:hypothetical protein DESC_930050 [Desulfosarcina cetonica]